jgi:8-oxo-dGTP diphosphatase
MCRQPNRKRTFLVTDTPNAASVALIRNDKVLLIKRAYAPYQHLWTLPGGRAELGETIEDCAAREVAEELSIQVRNLRPVLVQSLGRDAEYRLAVFASFDFSGTIRPSHEISDHKWMSRDALPALRTTSRLDDVLAKAFAVLGQS